MSDEIVATIWRRRVAWSRAADHLRGVITRARVAGLVLSASGAILATVAATLLADALPWRTWCAAAGALSIAAATFITSQFVTTDRVRSWTRARSVSEAIKAEVWSFRAAAEPYDGPDAAAVLRTKVGATETAARDLERYVAAIDVGAVAPPPPLSRDQYIEKRVRQQIETYYRPKARTYARHQAVLRGFELGLGLVATLLGALAAYAGGAQAGPGSAQAGIAAWVAVFTTLGAALAAHIAASRYDFLVMSFHATARQLEDLVDEWRSRPAPPDAGAWAAFVRACEDAISVENSSWLAKWAEQEPAHATIHPP